ncbi:hypothetical protein BKI52_25680 [marine bacterium AO1-C]|nr:hypothetical protein BKI52_25680 [marine bacterium AO1-C]
MDEFTSPQQQVNPQELPILKQEINNLVEDGETDEYIIQHLIADKNFHQTLATQIVQQFHSGAIDDLISEHQQQQVINNETNYDTLYYLLRQQGFLPEEAKERAMHRIAQHNLKQAQKKRLQALAKVDDEIKERVISWRNNAFSNKEITQKLVEKHQYTEEEAKKIVTLIHAEKKVEERATEKEVEEKKQHSYNVYVGAFLLVGGLVAGLILLFIDEDGDLSDFYIYLFGAAIGGLIQMIAGLSKKEYNPD